MEDRTYGVSAGNLRGDDIKMTVEESRALEFRRRIVKDSKNLLDLLPNILNTLDEIDWPLSNPDITAMLIKFKSDYLLLSKKNYDSVEDILYLLNITINNLESLESNSFLHLFLKSNKYYLDIQALNSKLITYYLIHYFDSKGIKLSSTDILRLKRIDFDLIGSLISR